MKPDGLHASDTHLRPRRGDEQYAFRQLVDAAIAEGVEYVCLAGDCFDKQSNRSEVVTFAFKEIDRLEQAGIGFLYTQGQHDADDPPWFSGHRWAMHLHKKKFDNNAGTRMLQGLDWQPFGDLQEALAEIDPIVNFLVCHQVWSDWMGDVASPQGDFAQIPGHVTHVHTGDLHQWKLEKHKNADGEKMSVLSTGATTQQKIDEPSRHYYALLYPDNRIVKKALKSRVFVDCSLMATDKDVEVFMSELEPTLAECNQKWAAGDMPPELQKPLIRVTYASRLGDVVRRVEKAVGDRANLVFKEIPPEEKTTVFYKAAEGVAVTPLSVLPDAVDKKESPQLYGLCERLLAAADPELAFAAWRAEYLGDAPKKDEDSEE